MHPGSHRALSGIYTQLTRCFKIMGFLYTFVAAANGILQGCPLSGILINLMTGMWKKILDAQSQDMRISPTRLPPGGKPEEALDFLLTASAMRMTHTARPRDSAHFSPCWSAHTNGFKPQGTMLNQRN